MHHEMSKEMQVCIKSCLDSSDICKQTIVHCLSMGGEHAEATHIQLLLDCAEICQTSANFMSRQSNRHSDICRICEGVCQSCAENCRTFDDESMERCADACERSAESCKAMAAMGQPTRKAQVKTAGARPS